MPTIEERREPDANENPYRRHRKTATAMPTIEERSDHLRDHHGTYRSALIAILAEFDAYKHEVSRRVRGFRSAWQHRTPSRDGFDAAFERFIIPEPGDPLAEVADEIHVHRLSLEQALAKRGLKLVEVGDEN